MEYVERMTGAPVVVEMELEEDGQSFDDGGDGAWRGWLDEFLC